jgi:hypothetical protein
MVGSVGSLYLLHAHIGEFAAPFGSFILEIAYPATERFEKPRDIFRNASGFRVEIAHNSKAVQTFTS